MYEHGTKATSMAGAFSARADDASAVFFNPAGLGNLEGWNAYIGGSILIPTVKFAGVNPYPGYGVEEQTKDRMFFPPGIYVTARPHEKIGVGIGVYAPFAIATEWDAPDFSGRYISKKADLTGAYISPSIGIKVNDMISVGANVNVVISHVELQRVQYQTLDIGARSYTFDVAELKITGDNGIDFGFDFGALLKPHQKIQLGLVYRAAINNTYSSGDAEFTQIPIETGDVALDAALNAVVASSMPMNADGGNVIGAATEITFPWQFVGGIMVKPMDKLSLEFDFVRFGWSDFDELPINFAEEAEDGDVNTPDDTVVKEDYEDSNQFRFGLEYMANEQLALRCGYVYDETPVPDKSVSVLLPDASRNDYSFGFGYSFGNMFIDAAYMLVDFKERSTNGQNTDNFNGTYKSIANIYSISFGRSF
ncbi:MAG: hypothetical protein GY869_01475 [Planctomycetes bacterium]|nr:hypothetical protein [Planctomycetota bacterium]